MPIYQTGVPIYGVPMRGIPVYGAHIGVPIHGMPIGVPIHGIPVHGIPGNVRIKYKKRAVPTNQPPTITITPRYGF